MNQQRDLKSDLCPECSAVPGECAPDCGQRGPDQQGPSLYDPPTDTAGVVDLLQDAVKEHLTKLSAVPFAATGWRTRTFADAGVLTDNEGVVLTLGSAEFQITVIRSH